MNCSFDEPPRRGDPGDTFTRLHQTSRLATAEPQLAASAASLPHHLDQRHAASLHLLDPHAGAAPDLHRSAAVAGPGALPFQPPPGTIKSSLEGTLGFARRIAWNGGSASASLINSLQGDAHILTRAVELQFVLSYRNGQVEIRTDVKVRAQGCGPALAFVLPAGTDIEYAARQLSDCRTLAIELDSAFILRASEFAHLDAVDIVETWNYQDPLSWQIARAMFAECVQGAPQGTLYSETAATLLAIHIVRTLSTLTRPLDLARRGGLPPVLLKRSCDYMMSRLSDNLSLQEVAATAGLSSGHFAVAFKKTLGLAPHAWLRRQRIARAKLLLRDFESDLTSIAVAVGYTNQSALGVAFKRETGLTPTQWRRMHSG